MMQYRTERERSAAEASQPAGELANGSQAHIRRTGGRIGDGVGTKFCVLTHTDVALQVRVIASARGPVLPRGGGIWTPWRHLPLHIPLSVVSGTSPNARINSSPSASTRRFGSARAGKITMMKREAAEILKDALALPTEARAALAASLLESLDTEVDEDAEVAWATEINRRVAELDSGALKTIPWAEVRRRLAGR
jgi:putative addiction module component (TIGR02574 family)